ncbi:MAG: transcriptional regulator [Nitrospirae bacterium]|nr:transcriptional regulator [Nitrospirota bacterium]
MKVGAIDEITMRTIGVLYLPSKRSFLPDDIRRIRTANHVSQTVFAVFLVIGKTTVQQWEQGQNKPNGTAQRLLDIIDRNGLAALGLRYARAQTPNRP